jgi:hypothetical protein
MTPPITAEDIRELCMETAGGDAPAARALRAILMHTPARERIIRALELLERVEAMGVREWLSRALCCGNPSTAAICCSRNKSQPCSAEKWHGWQADIVLAKLRNKGETK